jgi:hypothetical protein
MAKTIPNSAKLDGRRDLFRLPPPRLKSVGGLSVGSERGKFAWLIGKSSPKRNKSVARSVAGSASRLSPARNSLFDHRTAASGECLVLSEVLCPLTLERAVNVTVG